jgi:hypothetical protein
MREPRELNKQEKKSIARLKALASCWPQTLKLFDYSGSVVIVDVKTNQVFADILGFVSDGGDPGEIELDGVRYLQLGGE